MEFTERKLFEAINKKLDEINRNPEGATAEQQSILEALYSQLCKAMGISEHSQWRVEWVLEKFHNMADAIAGKPYDIARASQNIILDVGANEMLKIITGTGGTAYNNLNAKIGVGNNATAENATQTGLIATGDNAFYKGMDSGYPQVTGRQMIFKSTFDTSEANFAWNEFAIVNGTGVGAISMNRKVQNLGVKTTGVFSMQITISVTSTI